MTTIRFYFAVTALLSLAIGAPAVAMETSLTIDFSSTALKDGPLTTADWDTVSGTLHLPEFTASQIGSVPITSSYKLEVVGNYAFLAAGTSGLNVVDVTDPTAPVHVFDEGGGHNVRDVAVYGDLLFAAGASEGLHMYDLTDPTSPGFILTESAYNSLWGLKANGTLLFLADGTNGLRILNLPGTIFHLGTLNTAGFALDVDAAGGIAVVADNTHLRVIDVSNPTAPAELSNYVAAGASSVQLDYPRVYVGTYAGMLILDISDPLTPTLVGSYPAVDMVTVSVDWDYAAVSTLSELHIVDVRDPATPVQQWMQVSGDEGAGAVIDGGRTFWTDGDTFRIVESAMPIAMDYTYEPGIGPHFFELEAEGDLLYAARTNESGFKRVSTYDATDAMNPVLLGEAWIPRVLTSERGATGMGVSGGFVYTSDWEDGVHVIDARDPTTPVIVNQIPITSSIYGAVNLALEGSYLLVSGVDSLHVFNLYDPANPVEQYTTALGSWDHIGIEGLWAYFINSASDFHVMSLSDGSIWGTVSVPGLSYEDILASEGNHVYVVASFKVYAVDVQNPAAPVVLGPGTDISMVARRAELAGDRLFVLGDDSVLIMDISDPANITEILEIDLPAFTAPGAGGWDLVRTGDFLHVGGADISASPPYDNLHSVIPILSHRVDYHQNEAGTINLLPFNVGAMAGRILPASRTDSVFVYLNAAGVFKDDGVWSNPYADGGGGYFELYAASSLVDPMVDEITFEWAYENPVIRGITDTPNDQGRQVRLEWMKSASDFSGTIAGDLVTEYSVYRRVEAGLAPSSPESGVLGGAAMPPGDWDHIVSLPADQTVDDGHYSVIVPTLADSTVSAGVHYSTFYVRARTDVMGSVYDSMPDSGYSVDNLAPSIPEGFSAMSGGGGIALLWDPNPESDVQYYNVYRGLSSDFVPDELSRIGSTATADFDDPSPGGETHYKVTAVDFSGNEGLSAHTQDVTGVGMPTVTHRFQLHGARPNPFRAGSRVAFEVPEGGADISLRIYDVRGRAVRTLHQGWQRAGVAEVTWNGMDDGGRDVPVGVYFLKLAAPGFEKTARLVRVR